MTAVKPTAEDWTLADLRRANETRQALWCPDPAQQPDLSFRGNELSGEVGEALEQAVGVILLAVASGRAGNIVKKLERERHGWRGSRSSAAELSAELADVVICADLVALGAGIDLMAAVKEKFDATSEKVGLPTKLASHRQPESALDGARNARSVDGMADLIEGQSLPGSQIVLSVSEMNEIATALRAYAKLLRGEKE